MRTRISFMFCILCFVLTGCAGTKPSNKKILEDISTYAAMITYQNPFSNTVEKQNLEVKEVEVDKSRTEKDSYDVYYIVNLENDYFLAKRYIELVYDKYDGNEWQLVDIGEWKAIEITVRSNPFSESEYINGIVPTEGYDVELTTSVNKDNMITFNLHYKVDHLYATEEVYWSQECYFLGDYCYCNQGNKTIINDWNIEGSWKLQEIDAGTSFNLNVESFDKEAKIAQGTCYFSYYANNWGMVSNYKDRYDLSEASINVYANAIEFKFTEKNVVYIEYDEAEAKYHGLGSEKIKKR